MPDNVGIEIWACEHCGKPFEDYDEAEEHEELCPHNLRATPDVLVLTDDPSVRSCGTCRHFSKEWSRSAACPHGSIRRDCSSWALAVDLFWNLPKDVKPAYRQEVFSA